MTGREHLNWAAGRALEYFDLGDKSQAIASFLFDVTKHPATAGIATPGLTWPLLMLEYDRGRDAFERAMTGFAVSDARTKPGNEIWDTP